MGNPPWACLRKKDLGWDRGVESKKVVQHVYLVGAKSIYRVAEKDKEYTQLRIYYFLLLHQYAATFLLGKLKSSGAYQTFMNQTIGALHPVNTEFKEALCKVWRAGDLIATTNYDTQIEETLNAKGVSYECPAEILSIIRSTAENKVIHLHGMYDERDGIDNIIADYIQYQTILRNSGAQFIQNLIGTNPIIIVGCGGTMEDPCIFGRRLLLRVKPYIHRRRNISEFLIKLLIRQSNGLNSIQRKSNFRRHTLAYYFQD